MVPAYVGFLLPLLADSNRNSTVTGFLVELYCSQQRARGRGARSWQEGCRQTEKYSAAFSLREVNYQAWSSMATPDYTCSTAADCIVKNVGNCCGQYNACVNTAFVPDLQAVKAACSGMASICGWSDIDYCVCTAGRCEGQQGQPTQPAQPVWPASNFDLWPAIRIVAIIFDGLVLLLLLTIFAVPKLRKDLFVKLTSQDSKVGIVIATAIVCGAIGGVWWWWLPCIWWTCDAGRDDGHTIRIVVLCVTGPLMALCLCAYLTMLRRRHPQSPPVDLKIGSFDSINIVELNAT